MEINNAPNKQLLEISLDWLTWISLFASAISIVLGIVAIWLSIVFYKMSDKSSDEVKISTEKIDSNVSKLEKIFDTMYKDTFGMLKENNGFMREQVDKSYVLINSDKSIKTDEEIQKKIKILVDEQVSSLHLTQVDEDKLKEAILESIQTAQKIEGDLNLVKLNQKIIEIIKNNDRITLEELNSILNKEGISRKDIYYTLIDLIDNGVIDDNIIIFPDEGGRGILSHDPISLNNSSI